jgi:hypothetical protein
MIEIKTQMTRDFFVKEYVKLLYGKMDNSVRFGHWAY